MSIPATGGWSGETDRWACMRLGAALELGGRYTPPAHDERCRRFQGRMFRSEGRMSTVDCVPNGGFRELEHGGLVNRPGRGSKREAEARDAPRRIEIALRTRGHYRPEGIDPALHLLKAIKIHFGWNVVGHAQYHSGARAQLAEQLVHVGFKISLGRHGINEHDAWDAAEDGRARTEPLAELSERA